LNFTDASVHQVALYVVDWDGRGRVQAIDILAFGTTTVLDSRTVESFSGGQYLAWRLSGHVTIRVRFASGTNAVVSGVFFDGGNAGGTTPPAAVTGSATALTMTRATLTGTVNPNGVAATAYFQYGTASGYVSTTSAMNVGAGASAVPVATAIT